jgi:KEOPS complex subunit Pcc1
VKKGIITIQKQGKIADVVAKSLLPEMDRKIPRTKVNLKEDENVIRIEIQAQDVSALRAAINSYLRWMKVSMDTYEEIKVKS